jgi:GAF domain-containing protein
VVEAGDGIVGRTFTARRALTASGIAAVDDAFIERFPVKEAIAVPVRAEDDVVGVLYAGRRADGRPFGPSDVLLLLVIADRMGSAFVHQSLLARRSVSIAHLAELAELAGGALGRDLTESCRGRRRSRAVSWACVRQPWPSAWRIWRWSPHADCRAVRMPGARSRDVRD